MTYLATYTNTLTGETDEIVMSKKNIGDAREVAWTRVDIICSLNDGWFTDKVSIKVEKI